MRFGFRWRSRKGHDDARTELSSSEGSEDEMAVVFWPRIEASVQASRPVGGNGRQLGWPPRREAVVETLPSNPKPIHQSRQPACLSRSTDVAEILSSLDPNPVLQRQQLVDPLRSTDVAEIPSTSDPDTVPQSEQLASHLYPDPDLPSRQPESAKQGLDGVSPEQVAALSHLPVAGTRTSCEDGQLFARKYEILGVLKVEKPRMFRARNIYSGELFVLKFYGSVPLFKNCLQTYKHLKLYKYICKLHDFVDNVGFPPCLVFEAGTLTLEESSVPNTPSIMHRRAAMKDVFEGLTEMHKAKIVHCDVKPSNVVFFPRENRWKLVDLDSAKKFDQKFRGHTTPLYAAPEILKALLTGSEIKATPAMDMWSFGVMAFEILTGDPLFDRFINLESLCAKVTTAHLEEKIRGVDGKEARKLLRSVLKLNIEERRTVSEIATSAIFRTADTSSRDHPYSTETPAGRATTVDGDQ